MPHAHISQYEHAPSVPGEASAHDMPRPPAAGPRGGRARQIDRPGRSGKPLLAYLVILVLGVMLPLTAAGAVTLWLQFKAQRAQAETLLVNQAQSIARLVDAKFRRLEQVARTISVSPGSIAGDLPALRAEVSRAVGVLQEGLPPGVPPAEIVVTDAEGQPLFNSAPRAQQRYRPLAAVRDMIAAGRSDVSDLLTDPADGSQFVAVVAPVDAPVDAPADAPAPGRPAAGPGVVGAVVIAAAQVGLTSLVTDPPLPLGAMGSVQDRRGVTVARSVHEAETLGKLPVPVVLNAVMSADAGLAPRGTRNLEGVPSTIAFAHAAASGYIVKLDVPEDVFLAPLLSSVYRAAGLWAIEAAIAVVLAFFLMRRISNAFRGTLPSGAGPTGLREADALAAAFRAVLRDRDAAFARLREADATVRTLFENSPVGVVVADTGGRVAMANDAFLRTVGRDRAELEGGAVRWDEMTPPEWLPADEAAITQAVSHGRCVPYEKEYLRPDGARVAVLVSFGMINRATGTVASFVVDLTERKHAESELRESEAKFRTLADAMPQLVWSARVDGYIDYCNARFRSLIGLSAGEPIGRRWPEFVHPDDVPDLTARWGRALHRGVPFETQCRLRRGDGSYCWTLVRASAQRDPATGQIVRWFGTNTDISEIVEAREILARSRTGLEELIRQRTDALRESERLRARSERMAALGQLAGGIAHDFNNVLQVVLGSGSLMIPRSNDPKEVVRIAALMLRAAERGASITQRLLAFARRADLKAEAIDIAQLLQSSRDMLVHALGAGISIQLDVPPGLPLLFADRGQLETVLVNLATNARDAMSGRGTMTFAAAEEAFAGGSGAARPAGLRAGRYVRLSVSDTGCGMDEETLARVTEPFFTTKADGKGTGLGLAMAQGFADQSGGGLHIQSAPGRGTTVTLYLPVAPGGGPDGAAIATRSFGLPPDERQIAVAGHDGSEAEPPGRGPAAGADAADRAPSRPTPAPIVP